MLILPALDLLEGRCVRLYRGDYDRVTEYDRDPLAAARRFLEAGARALHLVDLDGAREGRPVNDEVVLALRRAVEVPLQVGGGLRRVADAERYLGAGVERVILGTAAVRHPRRLARLLERHGDGAVAVAVDVRKGRVAVEGWREEASLPLETLLRRLERLCVRTVIYTDVTRDGTLRRPDLEGTRRMVERGFRTLVAGGIARVEDVEALRAAGAHGAVIGTALYEGTLTLREAIRAAEGRPPPGSEGSRDPSADASSSTGEAGRGGAG